MTAEGEWEKFKRGVRPFVRRQRPVTVRAVAAPAKLPVAEASTTMRSLLRPVPPSLPPLTVTLAPSPQPDDPQWARALAQGTARIDARLDLHHCTESAAYQAVTSFINKARLKRWRLLLIITGRGAVLRQAVPRWLQEGVLSPSVRWVQPAAPRHGGVGAYYIVLARL